MGREWLIQEKPSVVRLLRGVRQVRVGKSVVGGIYREYSTRGAGAHVVVSGSEEAANEKASGAVTSSQEATTSTHQLPNIFVKPCDQLASLSALPPRKEVK